MPRHGAAAAGRANAWGVANAVARADGRAAADARRARVAADAAEGGVPGQVSAPDRGTARRGRTSGLGSGGSTHGWLRPRGPRAWGEGGVFRREQVAPWPVDAGMLAGASEGPVGPQELAGAGDRVTGRRGRAIGGPANRRVGGSGRTGDDGKQSSRRWWADLAKATQVDGR